jgi:hypothetical protein
MMGDKPPLKIYYSRASAWNGAIVAVVLLVCAAPFYFIVATPTGTTPTKTLVFALWVAFCWAGLLSNLYWILTPSPLLLVTTTGMVFHPWPFVTRTIRWADISSITAVKTSATAYLQRTVTLTLWVTVNPHAVAAYGNKPALKLNIRQAMLPMPVDKVVHLLQEYHSVTF